MTREEQLACLKDRPCDVCKMRTDKGCSSWECVFEQTPDEEKDFSEDCISREEVCDYIAEFVNHEYATDRERELVKNIIGGIQHLPSIQPKTELETWEGIHAQVTAPKGTFDKIWNEAEDNDEI